MVSKCLHHVSAANLYGVNILLHLYGEFSTQKGGRISTSLHYGSMANFLLSKNRYNISMLNFVLRKMAKV